MIYSKNEVFRGTSHHQVIYTILTQSKNFYIQLKRILKSLKSVSLCYTISEKH